MAIVGLIPFVYAAIKRKRRSTARTDDRYAYAGSLATGGVTRGHEHARGAYQSQSCHFAVLPSSDDELGFLHDDFGTGRRPPSKDKELSRSRELFQADVHKRATSVAPVCGRENARLDGGHQSQSCRFAVRPSSPVHGLVVSRDDGASLRPPAQPEDLSRQLLLPVIRHDGLAYGAARGREHRRSSAKAYLSQSCRFTVHHSAAYEHVLSHDAVASPLSEDLSGKLLLPASRSERVLSRSLRFSSMRVLAWVSGS